MKIAVIATDELKVELLKQGVLENIEIQRMDNPCFIEGADAYLDLLFENSAERIKKLSAFSPAVIIVHKLCNTGKETPENFVRINAWPGFLKGNVIEAACADEMVRPAAEKIVAAFNKAIEWVPDKPGFIAARVVSMIINEAYLAIEEAVSTKEAIDTAMKLGTNYPYGPFEWAKKIGLKNVYGLLQTLAQSNNRYQPSALLTKEAFE